MKKEYVLGEIDVMPKGVKNYYLKIIKRLLKDDKFQSIKEDVETIIQESSQQGNIDMLLKKIIDTHEDFYLESKKIFILEKNFKYGALFQLEDERAIQEILKSIQEKNEDNTEVIEAENIVVYTSFLDGMRSIGIGNNTLEYFKTTYSTVVKFWEIENGEKFVEVDVENVGVPFRQGMTDFFTNQIDEIIRKFQSNYLISLTPIDFSEVVYNIKDIHEEDMPQTSAQKMIMPSGAEATLDSNKTEEIILPILGDLKQLIDENSDLFENSPQITQILNEFIQDTEQMSYFPWVTLMWDNIIKTKRVTVKFVLEHTRDYTLLNYYTHRNGRQGMNDVVKSMLKEYSTIGNHTAEEATPA
ncbi:hypothetical protein AB6B24_04630 [Lactococcus sp. AK05]|uniref:hypothetical protein n=1 Tax=Lactococcus sp. AK05 TaxID=3239197 RepID=UPI0034DF1A7A